jgi:hypothetical protein
MFLRSGRGEDSETVGRVGDVNWMGGSEVGSVWLCRGEIGK